MVEKICNGAGNNVLFAHPTVSHFADWHVKFIEFLTFYSLHVVQ
jgi:hypothetical protein